MAAAINRITGALCFNNGDSAEERLREFLAVCGQDLKFFTHFLNLVHPGEVLRNRGI